MSSGRLIVVDGDDVPITIKGWDDLLSTDRYRVSALWVVDEQDRILLAKRALTKKHHPGHWGPAVAGTVEEGETYNSNIIKESQEELGLLIENPVKLHKERSVGAYLHFTQWFRWTYDGQELVPDPVEVAEVRWWTAAEILKSIEDREELFLSGMKDWVHQMSQ